MIFEKSYKPEVSVMRKKNGGQTKEMGINLFYAAVFAGLGVLPWVVGCGSIPLTRSADVAVQARRDLAQAVSLRGLPLKKEIAIERESVAAFYASLAEDLDKEDARLFLDDTERLLKAFRVLKDDASLKALYLRVMSQQVAAYYDPTKKRVAYVEENASVATNAAQLPGMERFVYVHEFCHAVEDSQFDLEQLTQASNASFDRSLAATSLIEGDAVLVGLDGFFSELPMNTATPAGGFAVQVMNRMGMDDAQGQMAGCPAFLGGALLRPYLDGASFSNRIRREAGWRAIDAIYRSRLPLTTAEILYPDKRYLKGFKAACFEPPAALFQTAQHGVSTNSLGVLGTALWFGKDEMVAARRFGFLEGWMGDRVYLLTGTNGTASTVWLTYLERPGQARTFARQVKRRLRDGFSDVSWQVERKGRLVVAVWTSKDTPREACQALAACALQTQVEVATPSLLRSWCSDIPWPIRIPVYDRYSAGFEVLGGHAVDVLSGDGFSRFNLADGVLLRAEANSDRHYYGTLCGLISHVEDTRSDFTCWRLPLMASYFGRGSGAEHRYRWDAVWGLLAYGDEKKVCVLFVPVWRY